MYNTIYTYTAPWSGMAHLGKYQTRYWMLQGLLFCHVEAHSRLCWSQREIDEISATYTVSAIITAA